MVRRPVNSNVRCSNENGMPTSSKANPNLALSLNFIARLIPAAVSCFAIYLGYRLFVLGVTGEASLDVDAKGIGGKLVNAAPGLFFAVGGIVALIVSVWKGIGVRYAYKNSDEDILIGADVYGAGTQKEFEAQGLPSWVFEELARNEPTCVVSPDLQITNWNYGFFELLAKPFDLKHGDHTYMSFRVK